MLRFMYHQSTLPIQGLASTSNHTGRIEHRRKGTSTGPLKLSATSQYPDEVSRGHWEVGAGHRRQKVWSKAQNPPRGHVS